MINIYVVIWKLTTVEIWNWLDIIPVRTSVYNLCVFIYLFFEITNIQWFAFRLT